MLARKALAGTAGAPKVYVEDVFSTYLYTGNASTQTITNNIDLSSKGGLVWIKSRSNALANALIDTVRGRAYVISSNLTDAEYGPAPSDKEVTSFNSDGFSLGTNYNFSINTNAATYASWTFRKAKKFFDVVTYTGNGSNRTISHNLGSTPGCIIVKRTDTTSSWRVFHRELDPAASLILNSTAAADYPNNTIWNATNPTSTVFSVGTSTDVNANGGTYVAYLFAHDAGGFGLTGSDNVISCGSYTGNGSATGPTVTLGYEPQWLLIKQASAAGNWLLQDNMRGVSTGGEDNTLCPNTADAENGTYGPGDWVDFTSTGFQIKTNTGGYNTNGNTYIYIAIRRGPMKTPTTGTSVFQPTTYTGNNTYPRTLNTTITPDLSISRARFSTATDPHDNYFVDRLRGGEPTLASNLTAAEDSPNGFFFDTQNGVRFVSGTSSKHNNSVDNYINLSFRRAPGFFDVVCYTGTGSATTQAHNLGVAPELMIIKRRNASVNWAIYSATLGNSKFMEFTTTGSQDNPSGSMWNLTNPTSSVFSLGGTSQVNASGSTYVAYLFATLAGVSKVGSYTGNGSSVTVTTNFQPRFILVKRTDSTGDWIVSDSARGLVAGNDPYLEFNTSDAEVTNEDWVDITSTSFTVNQTTNNANVNTGTYIYLAVS